MENNHTLNHSFAFGVNYKKTNLEIRSRLAFSDERKEQFLTTCSQLGQKEVIIISTCNRLEFYGPGNADKVIEIVCSIIGISTQEFSLYSFEKSGLEAVEHIFKVTAGLDSRILGDYEILGQFKNACKLSKQFNVLGSFLERLANFCIHASKEIKTTTELSRGTVSASFAAIEVLREKLTGSNHRVLIVGTGKFGKNVAKNISTYLPNCNITVCNRTNEKAKDLCQQFGFDFLSFETLNEKAADYEVIISSVDAGRFILSQSNFTSGNTKLILDLSVPQTINPDVKELSIELFTIDEISAILDKTLDKRKTFIPAAERIIEENLRDFLNWYSIYEHRSEIHQVKEKLMLASKYCPHFANMEKTDIDRLVNKSINQFIQSLNTSEKINVDEVVNLFIQKHQPVETNR